MINFLKVEKTDGEWHVVGKVLAKLTLDKTDDGSYLWEYLDDHEEPIEKYYIVGDEKQILEFWKKDRATQAEKIAAAETKLQEEKLKAPKIEKKAPEKAKPEAEQKKPAEKTGTQGK